MAHVTGAVLFVVGMAIVFFACPKNGKTSRVMRIAFFGELYAVAAISSIMLGLCIAVLG
jgi:hypothetical protein